MRMPCQCTTECSTNRCDCFKAQERCGATCHPGRLCQISESHCQPEGNRVAAFLKEHFIAIILATIGVLFVFYMYISESYCHVEAYFENAPVGSILLATLFTLILSNIYSEISQSRDSRSENDNLMVANLQRAGQLNLYVKSNVLVARPAYENIIRSYTETKDITKYMIVAGPMGCGKSIVVQSALYNVAGVFPVTLTTGARDNIFDHVLGELGGENIPSHEAREKFIEIVARAGQALGIPEWKPTVVFEVSGKSTDVLGVDDIRRLAKELATDTKTAHVIIVLSDANAVLGVPDTDDARQMIVWVEDFSIDEAHQYFNHLNFLVPLNISNSVTDDPNMQIRQRIKISTKLELGLFSCERLQKMEPVP